MSQMQTLALPEQIALHEAQLIASALSKNNGNTAQTAADLGIPVRTLNEKVSRYRLR